jgi:hypothetical protein
VPRSLLIGIKDEFSSPLCPSLGGPQRLWRLPPSILQSCGLAVSKRRPPSAHMFSRTRRLGAQGKELRRISLPPSPAAAAR